MLLEIEMPTEIYLIKVGMSMTEGMVEEWIVADGASVTAGEMLYRLETEKVNMDVDAEISGVVRHLIPEGVAMKPGDVIGYVYAPDEEIPVELPRAAVSTERVAPALVSEPLLVDAPRQSRSRAPSSPIARRLAHELGIDLNQVQGSGPGGRITREDVEAYTKENPASSSIPLKGMRKMIAERMFESLHSSAQLTMHMEVCMDEAVTLREQLISEWATESIRPTYTDLVVLASARALKQHPLMNSEFHEKEIRLLDEIHVGLAVAVEEGLVVPVIRDVLDLTFKELVVETSRLAVAARDGSLGLDDMHGGTFTVTALGMYGVDAFTPILNAPQAGILGVNRVYDGVGWNGDVPVKNKLMNLSLTWDHRVLDGTPAALFLGSVRDLLESPTRLLD